MNTKRNSAQNEQKHLKEETASKDSSISIRQSLSKVPKLYKLLTMLPHSQNRRLIRLSLRYLALTGVLIVALGSVAAFANNQALDSDSLSEETPDAAFTTELVPDEIPSGEELDSVYDDAVFDDEFAAVTDEASIDPDEGDIEEELDSNIPDAKATGDNETVGFPSDDTEGENLKPLAATTIDVSDRIGLNNAISSTTASDDPLTIRLIADISLSSAGSVTIPAGRNIILISDNGKRKLIGYTDSTTISVVGTLTLAEPDITVTHNSGKSGAGISVSRNATLNIEGGVICGNTRTLKDDLGAGVIINKGGTCNMNGGLICDNHLTGGTPGGAGVTVGALGGSGTTVFTMTGGEISNNFSNNLGGGVYVYSSSSTFIMSGGTISENTAPRGAGVGLYDGSVMLMSGGTISENHASNGGGVYVREQYNTGTSLQMSGGTISDNSAWNGGGVCVWDNGASFIMSGTAVVTGNTADNNGGGIASFATAANNITLNGGTLSYNKADANGGGVWMTDTYTNLNFVSVASGVVFSGNYAGGGAYNRNSADDGTYSTQIKGSAWSFPFTQGYNNYDISYVRGTAINVYTVIFDANEGVLAADGGWRSVSPNTSIGSSKMPTNPTRSGYAFTGWYTAVSGGSTFTASTTVTGDITVYARWSTTYKVTVTGSYAGTTGAGDYASGATVTIHAGSRTGYTFSGWTTSSAGVTFANASNATTTFSMPANAVTVTANWLPQNTVTIDEGGTGATGGGTYTQNATVTIYAGTRSGYVFSGWTTSSAGVTLTDSSSATTTFTMPGNSVTVTANWAQTFSVSVSGSEAVTTGAGSYTQGATVTIDAGTRTGFSFAGWTSSPSVSFVDAALATTTFTMPGEDVALTATWLPLNLVTVLGAYAEINGSGIYAQGATVTIQAGSRTDFIFTGWTIVSGGITLADATSATTTFTMGDSAVTVSAEWLPYHSVTVTDSFAKDSGAGTYKQGETVSLDAGSRDDFIFTGWTVDFGGVVLADSTSATTTFTMGAVAVGVTAKWLPYHGVIVHGSYAAIPGTGEYSQGELVSIDAGMRTGYTFGGWTVNSGNVTLTDASSPIQSFAMPASAVSITASWTAIGNIPVTFDANTTDVVLGPTPADKTVTYDAAYGPLASVSRLGYVLEGWYTQSTGGTKITQATKVSTLSAHTLYAHWTLLDPGDGDVATIGDRYSIFAYSPVLLTPDEAKAAQGDGGLTACGAYAYLNSDQSPVTVQRQSGELGITQGSYTLIYEVEDDPTCTVAVRFIVVDHQVWGQSDTHLITAISPVFLTPLEANAISDGGITKAQVKAWDKRTGSSVGVKVLSGAIGESTGTHKVTYAVLGDDTCTVEVSFIIKAQVMAEDDNYLITANTPVHLSTAQAALAGDGIDAAGVCAWRKSDGASMGVLASGSLSTSPGAYLITYTVDAPDASPATSIDVLFVISDGAVYSVGNEYVLVARTPVHLTVDEAITAVLSGDAGVISAAGAHAYKLNDGTPGTVVISGGALGTSEKSYLVSFEVDEDDSATATVNFTVVNSVVISGDDYEISAISPVFLTLAEAAEIDDEGVAAARVRAWDKTLGLDASVTTSLLSGAGLGLGDAQGEGTCMIRYAISDESYTYIDVLFVITDSNLIVSGDGGYIITARSPVILTLEEDAAITDDGIVKADVHVYYKGDGSERGVLATRHTGISPETYTVTYTAADDATAFLDVFFIVTDNNLVDEGPAHVITGSSPVVLTVFDAFFAQFDGGISAAHVVAYDKVSGLPSAVSVLPSTEGPGYGALGVAPGRYDVTYRVDSEHATQIHVVFLVVGPESFEADGCVISADSPIYLSTVQAQSAGDGIALAQVKGYDKKTGDERTVVLSSGAIGSAEGSYRLSYAIEGVPTCTITVLYVVTDNTVIVNDSNAVISANTPVSLSVERVTGIIDGGITAANVQAWSKTTGLELDIDVTGSLSAVVGTYKVTYSVRTDPTCEVEVLFVVVDGASHEGTDYVICGKSPVLLTVDEAQSIISGGDGGIDAAQVMALWKGAGAPVPSTVSVASTSQVLGSAVGSYKVTYQVDNEDTTTLDVVFIVTDSDVVVNGTEHVLSANSPVLLTINEAQAIDDGGIAAAQVKAWKRSNGASAKVELASIEAVPLFLGGSEGSFKATYRVVDEPECRISVVFIVVANTVYEGDDYIISANSPVLLSIDEAAAVIEADDKGVAAAHVRAYERMSGVSSSIVATGTINAAEGRYVVRYAAADDASAFIDVVFIVTSGLVSVDDDYVITATSPVVLTLSEAAGVVLEADGGIRAANVVAYEMAGGTEVAVHVKSVGASGAVAAAEGAYYVTFEVDDSTALNPLPYVTVLFVVTGDSVLAQDSDFMIVGKSPVVLTKDEAAAILAGGESAIITKAGICAYDKTADVPAVAVIAAGGDTLAAQVGSYKVNFTISGKTQPVASVLFIVTDTLVSQGSEYVITATSPVQISLAQASLAGDGISLAHVSAYAKADGKPAAVSVKSGTIGHVQGVYPMTYQVDAEKSTTIEVVFIVSGNETTVIGDDHVIMALSPVLFTVDEAAAVATGGLSALADAANVRAYTSPSGISVPLALVSGSLVAASGSWPVVFGVSDGSGGALPAPVIKVDFIVTADSVVSGNEHLITAQSVVWLTPEEAVLAVAMADDGITAASVAAYHKGTGAEVGVALSSGSETLGTSEGSYAVRYCVASEPLTEIGVLFIVTDNKLKVEGKTHVITANNPILLTEEEASAITDGGVSAAGVKAYRKSDGASVGVSISGNIAAKEGRYQVTYHALGEISCAVTVTFIVTGSVTFIGDEYAISAASPVFLDTKDAAELITGGQSALIAAAHAHAWSVHDGSAVAVRVQTGALGVTEDAYEVTFEVADDADAGLTKVTVLFVVTDADVVVSGDNHVICAYSPVILTTTEAETLLAGTGFGSAEDAAISAAEVKAYLKTANTSADVDVLDWGGLTADEGAYTLTFCVKDETSCTADVVFIVTDNEVIGQNGGFVITATSPVYLNVVGMLRALGDGGVGMANVRAWDVANGGVETGVFASKGYVGVLPGLYKVEFAVLQEPDCKVEVDFVVLGNLVEEDDDYVITGMSPVILSLDKAAAVVAGGDVAVAKAAYVSAYVKESALPVGVVVDTTGFKAEEGVYQVAFSVEGAPEVTIESVFVVTDDNLVLVGERYVLLAKSPVHLTTSEAAALIASGDEHGIDAAHVRAFEIATGNKVSISWLNGQIGLSEGTYDLTYRVDDDEDYVIEVSFIVSDTPAPPEPPGPDQDKDKGKGPEDGLAKTGDIRSSQVLTALALLILTSTAELLLLRRRRTSR